MLVLLFRGVFVCMIVAAFMVVVVMMVILIVVGLQAIEAE